MLAHFRLTVPTSLAVDVRDLLLGHDHVTNVTVQPGAVVRPAGDLVEADVARESSGALMDDLRRLGLHETGGIVITSPTGTPFAAADALEDLAPGHPDDAVIWDAVEDNAEAGAVPTLSYHLFLVIAVALAAIAVLTDSAVLVVGAMVVGPEFGPITAISAGIVLGRPGLLLRSLRLVVFSFVLAVLVVTALSLAGTAVGWVDEELVTRPRPNTGFIFAPDHWSFVVGVLAGAAGALAVALQRASTMVGVFISVTTVPALGNLALGVAVWERDEVLGSLAQLGLNVAGMVVSGVVVLLLVRTAWPWLAARSDRIFGVVT
ncbi:DUF389 domain-containing protein [Nocardioides sp. 1609]|uniref:DUF389 domain-containing protein n=1 Tax=Nocardioides sp. 1609 TaxID=2508327 RepID=UPI0010705279|nr:DUF389 domain-containing protein [Nocardioides sp. 1609]